MECKCSKGFSPCTFEVIEKFMKRVAFNFINLFDSFKNVVGKRNFQVTLPSYWNQLNDATNKAKTDSLFMAKVSTYLEK